MVANCTFRNDNAVNLADYACVTRPQLGQNWITSYNHNANTTATVLILGLAGPGQGPPLWGGEWLVSLATPPFTLVGSGNIAVPVQGDPWLAGVQISTQGFRLDVQGSVARFLLLNAQDIMLGN